MLPDQIRALLVFDFDHVKAVKLLALLAVKRIPERIRHGLVPDRVVGIHHHAPHRPLAQQPGVTRVLVYAFRHVRPGGLMFDPDHDLLQFAVNFHFHDQKQIAAQAFLQGLIFADKFFVNKRVRADGDVWKRVREEVFGEGCNQPFK